MPPILRLVAAALVAAVTLLPAVTVPARAAAAPPVLLEVSRGPSVSAPARAAWRWPVTPPQIVAPYVAPAHAYGPGHRGVDLAAPVGTEVAAPADGVVAFAGTVAGRGVVTIDHGDGLVTTLEPVDSPLVAGTRVAAGDVVGIVAEGGHAASGTVHFGVRRDGEYINPLLLFGGVPRAVLLPCC
ncbi:murein hydrolase activator EnvC family protein [Microbacterium sp.]|uniref:murein hydrolase activator EnvC family protein n=1 Tax=Microbacterium sp. TaxID=51671 RepID=UPI0039E65633